MRHYTTDPDAHAAFIRSLRDLADYLDQHPGIPVPQYGAYLTLYASPAEDGGRVQVDHLAALLDVAADDDTAYSGHYSASRSFGVIGYEIHSISALSVVTDQTPMCYQACPDPAALPDTWT